MPTSAPGNSHRSPPAARGRPRPAAGFTLLELLMVVALIALASAVAVLALPDPDATRLEREGQRLATLLEAGRAQSRALGVPVQWRPAAAADGPGAAIDFRFDGLPEGAELPQQWLQREGAPAAELPGGQAGVLLGPEPVIGVQRIVLHLGAQRLVLATDGLGPFQVVAE